MIKSKLTASIESKLNELSTKHATKIDFYNEKLRLEYQRLFKKQLSKEIDKALANLDSSTDYCFDECSEIQHWVRATELLDSVPDNARQYLEEYLTDYCVYVNWEHDTIYHLDSDSIVINEHGEVYEGRKKLFNYSHYEGEEERNALIEKHMETTGYYPGVYRTDGHGNVFPVSTQPQK